MRKSAAPLVLVVMGSESDRAKVQPAADELDRLGLPYEWLVASAHRTPEKVATLARQARGRGIKVIIAAAGAAAHLAGVTAAHTTLPVIGIPISSRALNGMDALLSTVQMPGGIPVAAVAIDGARNAALLAAQILAVSDSALATKLDQIRKRAAQTTRKSPPSRRKSP